MFCTQHTTNTLYLSLSPCVTRSASISLCLPVNSVCLCLSLSPRQLYLPLSLSVSPSTLSASCARVLLCIVCCTGLLYVFVSVKLTWLRKSAPSSDSIAYEKGVFMYSSIAAISECDVVCMCAPRATKSVTMSSADSLTWRTKKEGKREGKKERKERKERRRGRRGEGGRRGVTPVYEYAALRTPPHTAHRTPHRSRWVRFSILLVSSPYSRVKTI